jgi:hypothetical protein
VSGIDTAANQMIATVPVGVVPSFVGITPNGSYIYVTNNSDDSVSVIDTVTSQVVGPQPTVFRAQLLSEVPGCRSNALSVGTLVRWKPSDYKTDQAHVGPCA